MGSLSELNSGYNTHLIYTNSNKAELYIYDILKGICNASRESIYEVETKKDFSEMVELSSLQPYLSDRWLFIVNYSKTKSSCKQFQSVFGSDTSIFLIKVANYRDFKECKQLLGGINDIYLAYMRRKDVNIIFSKFKLSQKVVDFIANSYASDLEKLFELKEKIEQGEEVKTTKDVVSLIGSSGGSVAKFALQLLADPPKTQKGLKMVMHNRVRDLRMLCETYSIRSIRNFLVAAVKDILDIKVLYNQGVIFKQIRDLPDMYDEKRLLRYNFCLERIESEIPYTRILNLYCKLKEEVWVRDEDLLNFIYKYYGGNVEWKF